MTLCISAAIFLILFWKGPNAVWGGLTLGLFVGLSIAIFFAVRGESFSWSMIGKTTVVGVLVGSAAEFLGKLASFLRKLSKTD